MSRRLSYEELESYLDTQELEIEELEKIIAKLQKEIDELQEENDELRGTKKIEHSSDESHRQWEDSVHKKQREAGEQLQKRSAKRRRVVVWNELKF